VCSTLLLSASAHGKKEWPEPQNIQESFTMQILCADRTDNCLSLQIVINGAVEKLYRASIQFEPIGDDDGGCESCPFVPRDAEHYLRSEPNFILNDNVLTLKFCSLNPLKNYRFRVAGESELSIIPIVYTNTYVTTQ
jgi:hypothetical protein